MNKEREILCRLFKSLSNCRHLIGEDNYQEIRRRLTEGSLKSEMFDTVITDTRNYILKRELSYEEFISRLNPPVRYVDKYYRNFIMALQEPLCEFLRNPFIVFINKFKKKKEKNENKN